MSRTYRYVFNASIVRFSSPHDGKHLRRCFPAPPHHLQVYQDAHFLDCSYCCKHTLSTPRRDFQLISQPTYGYQRKRSSTFRDILSIRTKAQRWPSPPRASKTCNRCCTRQMAQCFLQVLSARCELAILDALMVALTDSNFKAVWNRATPSVSILPTLRKGYATDPAAGEIERRLCRSVRH